jgi:hypothetical protein
MRLATTLVNFRRSQLQKDRAPDCSNLKIFWSRKGGGSEKGEESD